MPINPIISLAQEAENRKAEIELLRNIPKDLIQRVKDLGLVKKWTAKEYDGEQASVSEVTQMIQSIAYHNASLAWVIGVTGCTSLFSGFLSPSMAAQLFGDSKVMIGGFAAPAGIARKVKDGLEVSGKWSWGSGITHSSHIAGGVMLKEGGKMIGTAVVFFRPDEIKMHDNWHVLGLKGTHSIDYSAQKVFIPDNRWSRFPLKTPMIDAPLYRFSFLGALSLAVASVGLGLAKRALEEINILAQVKSPFGMGKKLAQKEVVQVEFGKLQGAYLAAIALFQNTIEEAESEAKQGLCSIDSKVKIRLAACHSLQLAEQVVSGAYRLAGGSAIWENHKLEELMRDVQVVAQHGMVSAGNYRTVGAFLLGNKVPETML
ncbi:MAG: acyl-CoA dehydrogenase family protein [Chitinophagales bacterium]